MTRSRVDPVRVRTCCLVGLDAFRLPTFLLIPWKEVHLPSVKSQLFICLVKWKWKLLVHSQNSLSRSCNRYCTKEQNSAEVSDLMQGTGFGCSLQIQHRQANLDFPIIDETEQNNIWLWKALHEENVRQWHNWEDKNLNFCPYCPYCK